MVYVLLLDSRIAFLEINYCIPNQMEKGVLIDSFLNLLGQIKIIVLSL